jgi:hypothetical protein
MPRRTRLRSPVLAILVIALACVVAAGVLFGLSGRGSALRANLTVIDQGPCLHPTGRVTTGVVVAEISVYHDGVIAARKFSSTADVHFALLPGRYTAHTNGFARTVELDAGQAVTVNLSCFVRSYFFRSTLLPVLHQKGRTPCGHTPSFGPRRFVNMRMAAPFEVTAAQLMARPYDASIPSVVDVPRNATFPACFVTYPKVMPRHRPVPREQRSLWVLDRTGAPFIVLDGAVTPVVVR